MRISTFHTLLSHLLTYIFNFPVDTLNKNFMKMVGGGCAMKERVLLNSILPLLPPLPSFLFVFTQFSCFSAQPGNEIFNGQIVARNSTSLVTREINSWLILLVLLLIPLLLDTTFFNRLFINCFSISLICKLFSLDYCDQDDQVIYWSSNKFNEMIKVIINGKTMKQ